MMASRTARMPISQSCCGLGITEGLLGPFVSIRQHSIGSYVFRYRSYFRLISTKRTLLVPWINYESKYNISRFRSLTSSHYEGNNRIKPPQSCASLLPCLVRIPLCNIGKVGYVSYRKFSTKSEQKGEKEVKIDPLSIFREPNHRKGLQCLLGCLRKEARIVIPTFIALLASSALISMFPTVVGSYINNFSVANVPSIVEGLVFVACSAFASFMKSMLSGFANTRVARRMREDLYMSLLKKDASFFDTISSGRLSSIIGSDVAVSSVIVDYLCQTIRSTVSFVAGIVFSLKLAPITLIGNTLLPIVVSLAAIFPLSRYVQKHTSLQMRRLAAMVSHTEERVSNIKTVKAFNAEEHEYNVFMDKLGKLFTASITTTLFSATMNFIAVGSMGSLVLLMVNRSANLVLDGTMRIGDVTSLLMYTVLIGGSIQSFTSSISGIQKCVGAAASVASYIDNYNDNGSAKTYLTPNPPAVEFRNVSFSYPSRPDSGIIRNISFILPAKSTLVVFGESGCGKSSLVQLLLGFYQPNSGSILIDNINLGSIDIRDLRYMTGWVEQQGALFNDTIRNNVLYGQNKENVDLTEAYDKSGLSQVISSLKDGEETKVGQMGKALSGGQRQRVSLARMFARHPKLVLLDEASAALDMESEHKLNDELANFLRDKTAIIISHRISLLSMANYIMVLNAGEIAQFGTKDDVLRSPCALLSKMLTAG